MAPLAGALGAAAGAALFATLADTEHAVLQVRRRRRRRRRATSNNGFAQLEAAAALGRLVEHVRGDGGVDGALRHGVLATARAVSARLLALAAPADGDAMAGAARRQAQRLAQLVAA